MFLKKSLFVCGVFSLMTSSCFFKHKKHETNLYPSFLIDIVSMTQLLNMSEVEHEQWCVDQQKKKMI